MAISTKFSNKEAIRQNKAESVECEFIDVRRVHCRRVHLHFTPFMHFFETMIQGDRIATDATAAVIYHHPGISYLLRLFAAVGR